MIQIRIPAVRSCTAIECAYNRDAECHAAAITIGDAQPPHCDTWLDGAAGHTGKAVKAGVGACKVRGCAYNDDLECQATTVSVAVADGQAHCTTFSPR